MPQCPTLPRSRSCLIYGLLNIAVVMETKAVSTVRYTLNASTKKKPPAARSGPFT